MSYSLKTDTSGPTAQQVPAPTPLQAKAYELLNLLPVAEKLNFELSHSESAEYSPNFSRTSV
jgi:hypothetical protein